MEQEDLMAKHIASHTQYQSYSQTFLSSGKCGHETNTI